MTSKASASTLKKALWDTLEGLRAGKVEIDEALAVSGLAKAIVNVTNVQLKISIHSGREMPKDIVEFSESKQP